jgi:hypothetical protein
MNGGVAILGDGLSGSYRMSLGVFAVCMCAFVCSFQVLDSGDGQPGAGTRGRRLRQHGAFIAGKELRL